MLITISVNPAAFSFKITCSNIGRPAMGTKAFGMVSVSGYPNRLQISLLSFFRLLSSLYLLFLDCCLKRMFDVLFPMHQFDFHTKFLIQVLCQVLG